MANRRWLKIGSGIAATITTVAGLFILFSLIYNFQIVDLTGDFFCEGTYHNPCISEFEVKNPNSYNVDIYSNDQVKLEFSPEIEDYALFVEDGRCSATGKCVCELKNNKTIGFYGWRCVDFTNKTKPRQDREYNFRFSSYSTTKFRLAGIKKNPGEEVKWTFGINETELDPVWKGKEGGGVIIPDVTSYRIHDDSENYNAYFENEKLIIEPLKETGETLSIKKSEIKSKIDSKTPEIIAKKNERFELTLDKKSKYYEIENENITIEGVIDNFCGINCVSYFEIKPISKNLDPGLEIYTEPGNVTFYLYNLKIRPDGREEWRIVKDPKNFEFKENESYRFKILLFKEEKENVKWGVRALGEELDPYFYGSNDILLIWGHGTNNYPNYAEGSSSNSWGSVQNVHTDVVADTTQMHLVQNPISPEKLLIWIDTTEDIHAKFWDGSSWSNYAELEIDGYISDRFVIAAAVESESGDYLVAYSRSASDVDDWVAYQTYSQETETWSGVQMIDVDLGAQTESMVMASDPNSDNIILLASESGDSLDAWIWDGDSFENHVQLSTDLEDGSSGDPTTYIPEVPFAAAFLNSTGEAVVLWGNEGDLIYSKIWSGSWGDTKLQLNGQLGDDVQYIMLKSSMWEDKIRGGFFDNGNEVWGFELNDTLDIINFSYFGPGYTNYPYKSIDVVMPEAGKFVYAWGDNAYGYYMVNNYNAGLYAYDFTTNDVRQVSGDFVNDIAMFSCGDDGLDLSVFMYNITSDTESYTDDIETSLEETFSHAIQPNVYYQLPPVFNPNITECKELNWPNKVYHLVNDIAGPEDCIVISANNITLEGDGYNIDFGYQTDVGYWAGVRMLSSNSEVRNLTMNTTDPYCGGCQIGVWMDTTGGIIYNNIVEDLRLDASRAWAVPVDVEGENHLIRNIYVENGYYSYGSMSTYKANNITFENIIVNNSDVFEDLSTYESTNILFKNIYEYNISGPSMFYWDDDNSTNITVQDSVLNASIYLDDITSNLTFINTTYPEEEVGGGWLTRKWYFGFQINDSNTNEGVYIPLWTLDDKDDEIETGSTDANGYQEQFSVIHYINKSGVTDNRNPHTIQATKTGYVTNTTSFTLNTNIFLQLWTATLPNVSGILNLPQFQFGICGTDFENASAKPLGQTPTIGTINLTNTGGSAGTARIKYTGTINDGWILYATNSSQTQIELSGAYQNIVNLDPSETEMIWMYANCSYVHANPGVNIDFDII